MKAYYVLDKPTEAEKKTIGHTQENPKARKASIVAIATGEKREPKAGEWYIDTILNMACRCEVEGLGIKPIATLGPVLS
jgi:hypothetical protein